MKRIILLTSILLAAAAAAAAQPARALVERARAAIEKNQYEAALKDLDAALAAAPADREARTQRARVLFFLKRYDEAAADADRALAADPTNALAANVRGLVRAARNDLAGAIADFGAAIASDPSFAKAYINRARAHRERGDFAAALADAAKAVELDPANTLALYTRGNLLLSYKKYDEAIRDFTAVVALDPKHDAALSERAYAYASKGNRLAEVLADAGAALAANPRNFLALTLRGWARAEQKEFDAALPDFAAALAMRPGDELANRLFRGFLAAHPNPSGIPLVREKLAAFKTAAERSEQNYGAYLKLYEFFELTLPKPDPALDFSRTLAFKDEQRKTIAAYFEALAAADPKNVCASYFAVKGYSYNFRRAQYDRAIENFDGARGGACSAQAALAIAEYYREKATEIDRRSAFDDAVKAEAIEVMKKANGYYRLAADRDPQSKDARSWLASQTERVASEEAALRRSRANTRSAAASNADSPGATRPAPRAEDAALAAEIIAEYDRLHAAIEADLREYLRAYEKLAAVEPQFRSFYRKTQLALIRARENAQSRIAEFLKKYEKVLPAAMRDHLLEDSGRFVALSL